MACFSPKPLYQTSEPTMASAALVQANRFAQQGKYDEALRLIDGEEEDSPTSLMVRMVCEWKGLKELDRALALKSPLLGVNNRNLKTMVTDIATTEELAARIPADRILISESGLYEPSDLARMAAVGARCFLVGESLMRQEDVRRATAMLLSDPVPAVA